VGDDGQDREVPPRLVGLVVHEDAALGGVEEDMARAAVGSGERGGLRHRATKRGLGQPGQLTSDRIRWRIVRENVKGPVGDHGQAPFSSALQGRMKAESAFPLSWTAGEQTIGRGAEAIRGAAAMAYPSAVASRSMKVFS
jgi:hypothetical protein